MAGDWVKIRRDLPDDVAILTTATALGQSENEVLGACVRFWLWANGHTADGMVPLPRNAPGVTAVTPPSRGGDAPVTGVCAQGVVDRIARLSGFAECMEHAGWLEIRDGCFNLPRYDRHMSKSAKQRALAAERQAEFRRNAGSVTDASRGALPEKRREEDNNPPTPQGGGDDESPAEALPEGFAAFWDAYPRKVGKKAAVAAWKKAKIGKALAARIPAAVEAQKNTRKWREGYIPNPATWLNQGRWDDEVLPEDAGPRDGPARDIT